MLRYLAIPILLAATAAGAQSDDEDAAHRGDRLQTEQLNRQALRASRPQVTYRDEDRRDYQAARERYERQIAEWRRRVAACQAGDWSACDQR